VDEQAVTGGHGKHEGCLDGLPGALGGLTERKPAILVELYDAQLDGLVAAGDAAVLGLTLERRLFF